ncbi:hypothetical protein ROSMUCSMR3_02915 [Roseovarius mucosus]|uniref:Uncharacterized protein n=1 Tax=Roseovarius mucosus TaxID=215743 RepID=A0A1V0RRY9_9RHOB|nr:hypothetical protein [Roseovarius mucosus]ARE84382.1 hypothetical protein ROSMUCSMR3_02915 [Roseovarius mucosus]
MLTMKSSLPFLITTPFCHESESFYGELSEAVLEAFVVYALSSNKKSVRGVVSIGEEKILVNASLICSSEVEECLSRFSSAIWKNSEDEIFSMRLSDIFKYEEFDNVNELKKRASKLISELSGAQVYVSVSDKTQILAEHSAMIFQAIYMRSHADDITYDPRVKLNVSEFVARGVRLESSNY